jgi:hypothetical protein
MGENLAGEEYIARERVLASRRPGRCLRRTQRADGRDDFAGGTRRGDSRSGYFDAADETRGTDA